jgi:uncharacterized protein (TIGR00369 family)
VNEPSLNLDAIAKLSGLEVVRGLSEGRITRPPMASTLPFVLHPPSEGLVEMTAHPEPRFANLEMTAHGGWIMTMLDTAMALAALTTLPPGEICPSHETSAKFVRPIPISATDLKISGRVLSRTRTVITADGEIRDTTGKLLAHGTTTCLTIRPRAIPVPE